jgi:YVTN family beta-propeller protein
MKILSRGYWCKLLPVIAPVMLMAVLSISGGSYITAGAAAYGTAGGAVYGTSNALIYGPPPASYQLDNQLLYVANGRASNVKVIDVGSMSVVDTIPVPKPIMNANASAGQGDSLLDKTLAGLRLSLPAHIPDMFYWEVHGVVPSRDRTHIYAVGALSFTPADDNMYEVNTKSKALDRTIPLAPKLVGYCGLEYNQNDESSNTLYAASMATGPTDLATLFGLPLKPQGLQQDPLGVSSLVSSVTALSPDVGGLSQENIATGQNTGFISTDWNMNANSSTCGIAWTADGTRAYASQMFEPLIDTLDWGRLTATGEINPSTLPGTSYHQETSAKSRGLLFVANSAGSVDVFDMNVNALVGSIDMNTLSGVRADVHGVEIAPGNDNVLYVTVRGAPGGGQASEFVVDVSNLNAPAIIGGVGGLDGSACGVYADANKSAYYRASGACKKPELGLSSASAFWASLSDYQNRALSVTFGVSVSGGPTAKNVIVTNIQGDSNAHLLSTMPIAVGDVSSAHSGSFTAQYYVPEGAQSFSTVVNLTAQDPCGNTYYYPSPRNESLPTSTPS